MQPFDSRQVSYLLLGTSAKFLLRHMLTHPSTFSPTQIAIQQQFITPSASLDNWSDNSGTTPPSELQNLCQEAIAALPQQVEAFRSGQSQGVVNKIVGYVMRKSKGRTDAMAVRKALERMILQKDNST